VRRPKRSDITDEEMLEAVRAFWREADAGNVAGAQTPDVSLAHKYPVKVIMAKLDHLSDRGVIDYGVSLRTAWIVAEQEERHRKLWEGRR
jgi:hypothetical protein